MKQLKWMLGLGLASIALVTALNVGSAQKQKTFVLVPKAVDNPFFAEVEKGCKEGAAKLGVVCNFIGPKSLDEAEQVQILKDLVAKGGIDGLGISPTNPDAVVAVIAEARKKGINVITFDADSPKSQRIAYVGTNNLEGGREAGRQMKKLLPKGGKIAILTGGLAAANLNERVQGFRETAGAAYKEVAGSPFPSDDDVSKAVQVIADVMTKNPDIDGWYLAGGWPLFAPEAYIKALGKRAEEIKSKKLVVVGFDTLVPELKLLQQGYVNVLVGQRPRKIGSDAVQALLDLSNGKKLPEINDTGVDVVDETNIAQFLK